MYYNLADAIQIIQDPATRPANLAEFMDLLSRVRPFTEGTNSAIVYAGGEQTGEARAMADAYRTANPEPHRKWSDSDPAHPP